MVGPGALEIDRFMRTVNPVSYTHLGQTLTLYTYDLYEYKQVPDWLNAKFWANPENFGKYWW